MNLHQSACPKTRFRPGVETLEDRCVPAVTPKILGNSLILTGDKGDNTIVLNDTGVNNSLNITGTLDGIAFTSSSFVNNIVINTKGGKDKATYNLTGPLITDSRSLDVSLGAGDDQFTANLNGDVDRDAFFLSNVRGEAGNDKITYNAVGILAGQGSQLNLNADGGAGHDTIQLNFSSNLTGNLNFLLIGGADHDKITAAVNVQAGNGGAIGSSTPALMNGNAGDDQLDYRIHLDNSVTSVFARLDGGAGKNSCSHTANVISKNCKVDNIVQ
jgi:hypothetical protein